MARGKSASTEIALPKAQLPANFQDQMAADIAALGAKLQAPTGNTIRVTQSKQFKFPDETTVTEFKGVIVDFVAMNAWYEGDYDRDNLVPPNCFAIGDAKNEDLVASENSPDPQNADGDNKCRTCWANEWKSARRGNGKDCKNTIRLAVLCEDGELRPLSLSSTALKDFQSFVRNTVQVYQMPTYGVLTHFSFDDSSEYPSVRCRAELKLNQDQLAAVYSKRDEAKSMLLQEPDVSEFQAKVVDMRNKPKGGKGKPLPAAKGRAVSRANA